MESIVFEKQEAALCGQHALNMLLQGQYYTVEVLAELANRLDQQENGVLNEEGRNHRSQNMNASGFFSIQVMTEALAKGWNVDLININHPSMESIKNNPLTAQAFLVNLQEHWFVVRKFGEQWFELNSVKDGPQLLSNTFLSIFLHQLTLEHHSIFVVKGLLPQCAAQEVISAYPVLQMPANREKPSQIRKLVDSVSKKISGTGEAHDSREARDLAVAMAMSMEEPMDLNAEKNPLLDEGREMQRAIQLSLAGEIPNSTNNSPFGTSPDVSRRTHGLNIPEIRSVEEVEEEQLQIALQLSMKDSNPSAEAPKAPPQETPILRPSSAESMTDDSAPVQPAAASVDSAESIRTPSVEQQRLDREKFLKRFSKP